MIYADSVITAYIIERSQFNACVFYRKIGHISYHTICLLFSNNAFCTMVITHAEKNQICEIEVYNLHFKTENLLTVEEGDKRRRP